VNAVGSVDPARTSAAEGRRREIGYAAAELFDRRGFGETSMDDLAEAVGLRKPSLYHYFESKEEIVYWLHDEFITILLDRQSAHERVTEDPELLLLSALTDVVGLMETHPGFVRVFFEHHRELSPPLREEIIARRDAYTDAVRHPVAMLLGPEVDEAEVTVLVLALFGSCNWTYQWYRRDSRFGPEEIARIMWVAWLAALRGYAGSDERTPPA
jgi:TetR/AcrR family transcriptional regulator, cholesterol catabolism regulator